MLADWARGGVAANKRIPLQTINEACRRKTGVK
jgi:hypothetical protein